MFLIPVFSSTEKSRANIDRLLASHYRERIVNSGGFMEFFNLEAVLRQLPTEDRSIVYRMIAAALLAAPEQNEILQVDPLHSVREARQGG